MSEPFDPASGDPEYAAALDRFLDGLLDDGAAGGPADAAVRADTDAIAKALGLIGGALAADGGGVTATAGAVPPAATGATVVAMSSWRSKLNPRVLAAAATLVVLLGVGIPVALSTGGGSSHNDSAAMGEPESATDRAATDSATGAGAPTAPQAGPPAPLAADAYANGSATTTGTAGTTAGAVPGAASAPGTTGTDTSGTAAGGSAMDPKSAKSAASQAAADAERQAATPEFEQAVACARAIVIGTVTGVAPDTDGRHLRITVLVEKWIAPNKTGPLSVTYRVLGPTANSPGADESVYVGMRRLFVFAASEDERVYSFQEAAWPETKQKIAAIREKRAGQGC
ncbi:MAG TPA: hypothetical protein VNC22_07605 [Sporichthya sp.]|nr:hypothetical protein [Sporichthya sp.]